MTDKLPAPQPIEADTGLSAERRSSGSLRVLTWNLWWRFGDWPARELAIACVLERECPDICGLQEVWATGSKNQAKILATNLGMHFTWVPSPRPERWQHKLGDSNVQIGNAVLSRWPISATDQLHLPTGNEPDEGRTVLYASIDSPAGSVPVFTTQLNSAPHQSAVRCEQVMALAEFIAAHKAEAFPPVLTGDFNAEPSSDEIRLIEGHRTAPTVPGLVLIDAWRYADPGEPGHTWDHRNNPYVQASLEPSSRIDYVLIGLPRQDGKGHVRSVRMIGHGPEAGVWPSDHAGVLAELGRGGDQAPEFVGCREEVEVLDHTVDDVDRRRQSRPAR